MAAKTNRKRHWFWRIIRVAALVLAVLIVLPVVLVPLYLVVDPISTPMLARYLTGQRVERDWRNIDAISDRLKVSVVMSEDGQFCRHHGVDLGALRDEIKTFMAGGDARGASTISMQVARNLFLWQGRSVVRKALEVPLAVYLDLVLSKQRIMEIYLNIAEWGPDGEFGIEAGVEAAFGVDADALSWERASLMTVTLPNPHVRKPAHPSAGLRRIASIVTARAQQYSDRAWCLFDGRAPEL